MYSQRKKGLFKAGIVTIFVLFVYIFCISHNVTLYPEIAIKIV